MQKRIRQFSRSKQPDADSRDKVINRRAICKRGIDQNQSGCKRPAATVGGRVFFASLIRFGQPT
jgi:hypothetical protein